MNSITTSVSLEDLRQESSSLVELDTPQMIVDYNFNWIEARFGVSRLYSVDLKETNLLNSPCNLQGGSFFIKEHDAVDSIRNVSVTNRFITYNNYNKIQNYDNPILLTSERVKIDTCLPDNIILNVNDFNERQLMPEIIYNKLVTTERKVNEVQRSNAIFNVINNDLTVNNTSLDSTHRTTSMRIMDVSINPSLVKPVNNIRPKYVFYRDRYTSINNKSWEFYTLETIELNPNLPVKVLKSLSSSQLIEYICDEFKDDFTQSAIQLPFTITTKQNSSNEIYDFGEDVSCSYNLMPDNEQINKVEIEIRDVTSQDCFSCIARYPDVIVRDGLWLSINDFLSEDDNVLAYIDYLNYLNNLGSGVYYPTPNLDLASMAKVHIEAVTNLHNSNLVMAIGGSSFENVYSLLFSLLSKPTAVYDYLYNHTSLAKEVNELLDNILYALESNKNEIFYLDLVKYLKVTLDHLLMYKESSDNGVNNVFYGRNMFQGYLNTRNPALLTYVLCNIVTTLTMDLVLNTNTSVYNKPIITGTIVNTYDKLYNKQPKTPDLKLFKHLGANLYSILLYNTSQSFLNISYFNNSIPEMYSDISVINNHSYVNQSESELVFDSSLDNKGTDDSSLMESTDNTLKAQKMIYTNIQEIINSEVKSVLHSAPEAISNKYITKETACNLNTEILNKIQNVFLFSIATNTMTNLFNKTGNVINNFNTNYLSNLLPITSINIGIREDTKDSSSQYLIPRAFLVSLVNNTVYPDVRLTTKTDLDFKRRRVTTGATNYLTQNYLNNALNLHSNQLNGLSVDLIDKYFDYSNNEVVLAELQINNYFKSIVPGIEIDANEEYTAKIMQEILSKLSTTLQNQGISEEVKESIVMGLVDMWSQYYSNGTQTLKHIAYDILLRQLNPRFLSDSKSINQSFVKDVYVITGNTVPLKFLSQTNIPIKRDEINLHNLCFIERKVGVKL